MNGSAWINSEEVKAIGHDHIALMVEARKQIDAGNYVRWPMQHVCLAPGVSFEAAMDYFAIGTAEDFVYVPLDGPTAQYLAECEGKYLPTRKMVNAIWQEADVKVPAERMPMTPEQGYPYDEDMMHVRRLSVHTQRILDIVGATAHDTACMFAGHKKDVVIDHANPWKPNKVCIFGWHRSNGSTIQGPSVSFKHFLNYLDYSHGIRLIGPVVKVHGIDMPLEEALRDEETAKLFADHHFTSIGYPLPEGDAAPDTEPTHDEEVEQLFTLIQRGSNDKNLTGAPVARWQRYLMWRGHDLDPWRDDGDFGRVTTAATIAEQRKRLEPGTYTPGVVEQSTWKLWRKPTTIDRPTLVTNDNGLPDIAYVRAANFTHANRTDIRNIVLHTMEAGEHPGTAENVAAWFAGANAPQASAHYNVDGDSIVQSVLDEHVAWHAKGANRYGIGIEHAGYARQTDAGWHDQYSSAMLVLSAKLTASLCLKHGIPVRFVDEEGLRNGERGFTYHGTASRAFKVVGGHTDPGSSFPLEEYLGMVQAELDKLRAAA